MGIEMLEPLVQKLGDPKLWSSLNRLFIAMMAMNTASDLYSKSGDRGVQREALGLEGKKSSDMMKAMMLYNQMNSASADKDFERAVGLRREDRAEARGQRMTELGMGMRSQDNQMLMGIIQAMMQNAQPRIPQIQEYGPPTSLISLLR